MNLKLKLSFYLPNLKLSFCKRITTPSLTFINLPRSFLTPPNARTRQLLVALRLLLRQLDEGPQGGHQPGAQALVPAQTVDVEAVATWVDDGPVLEARLGEDLDLVIALKVELVERKKTLYLAKGSLPEGLDLTICSVSF